MAMHPSRSCFSVLVVVYLLQCKLFFVHCILNPLDFLALQSVRKSLDDMPGSNFFASWDFTSDPCNFAGVYWSPGLIGRLDPAIGKLSALTELSVVPGRIMGSLPQSISQLKDLRFLALTGAIPRSIGTIPGLSNVILSHNHISGSIPPFLSETLTRLELKHNELSGYIFDLLLSRLDRLNYLDLSMNQLSGCIPSRIFTFPITNLQLQRNSFSGPVQPGGQVTIPTVDLSYNRLSGGISPLFSTVQSLYLNNNRFTGQIPGSFADRLLDASIQILYLQHNYLTGMQINPTVEIPLSSSLCLQYNCMVPPIQTPCPLKAGKEKTRPTGQCNEWRG
ncbi:inactive leucine-rich repeat receptor protein kinase [Salix suchowensis]|nr:inactive leucine-rich repeat receptor protein kinase [Salix suchowensis]